MPEISQEELDTLKTNAAKATELEGLKSKLEKDLEDTRMEVLTPEYTKFLESLDPKNKKEEKKTEIVDDDLKHLSPKQLKDLAKKEALDEIRREKEEADKVSKAENARKTAEEIKAFAKEHTDFETYRPIMYGLSLEKKNEGKSLETLYTMAKEHITKLSGASEEEKKKQQKLKNEKPGNDSASFEKLRKMSTEAIGHEALEEVKSQLGPIPSA